MTELTVKLVDAIVDTSVPRAQWGPLIDRVAELEEAVLRQRDALAHWEDAARDLRAILENPTCRSTGEMLVALHERLRTDKLPPFVTTGTQSSSAKLARVRELIGRIYPDDRPVVITAQVRDILEALDE